MTDSARLIEIRKELRALPLDGLIGAEFEATLAKRIRLHKERIQIWRRRENLKKNNIKTK